MNDDDNNDEPFREIWDELEEESDDNEAVEKAYKNTARKAFGHKSIFIRHKWLKVAAIGIFPLLCLCSLYFLLASKQNKEITEIQYIEKSTAEGERCLVTLPDSTKVWLSEGSKLTYPSRFTSEKRMVTLSGEAFFDVVKDERPFIVDAGKIRLKVLGTTFNVFSYPDNPQVVATLKTGKLKVCVDGKDEPYTLTPNDQLVFDTTTGEVDVHAIETVDDEDSKSESLSFEDTEFRIAIQQLERAFNVKIHLLNDKYDNQTIRAHFDTSDAIENVMDVLNILIPSMNYEIRGNDIYIQ